MKAMEHMHPAIGASARVLGKIVMFPIVMTILLMAPIVYTVCGVLCAGGIFAAVLFEISAVGPRFPFLQVIGIAAGFGIFALLYHILLLGLIRE